MRKARRQRNTIAVLGALLFASGFINIIMFGGLMVTGRSNRPSFAREIASASQGDTILSSLPDGQMAYVNLDTVNQLSNGKAQSQTRVFTTREHDGAVWNSHWGLIKLNGELYVRGWATPNTVFASGSRKYNFVSHNPDSLPDYTTRTVPIEKFKDILDPSYIDQGNKSRGVFIPESGADTSITP